MTLLAATQISRLGTTLTYPAVSASDTIAPDGNMVLLVKNAGGSADTVTVVDSGTTTGGSAATSSTVNVPATTGEVFIWIPPQFVNASTGVITVTHSFTTTVTQRLFRV